MLFWIALVAAACLAIAGMGWRLRAARDELPLPAWTIPAFGLEPGERPGPLWPVQMADGSRAHAAITSTGAFVVGTEQGRALVRAGSGEAVRPEPGSKGEPAEVIEMTVVPAHGAPVTLHISREGASAVEDWANRSEESTE